MALPHRRPVRRRLFVLIATTVVVAVSAACSAGIETNDEGQAVLSVRTDVYFTGAVLPLVAGVQHGIYQKHGLQVELKPGTGSATTIQTVANGSDDIGYADAGTLVQSVAKGMPVKMTAGMVQQSPLALFAMKNSGITSPHDLENKTAGHTAGSAAERLFPAYAEAAGVDSNAVTFNNVDIPTRDSLFMQGKTDFTFGLLNVTKPNIAARCNCEPNVLPYTAEGVQTLSSGIVTGSRFANENPDVLRKFLAATRDAVTFANQHTDQAVTAFSQAAPDSSLSKDVVAAQWAASNDLLHSDASAGQAFGCTARADWQKTIELMERYGDVEDGAVSPGSAANNSFLPGGCTEQLGEST